MVKMLGLSIWVILLISLVAAGGVSGLNTPEELQAEELMLKYTWFNGDQEEQVFAALDEVAIFPKIVSEKTNVTERLVKNFDPTATLIKDYEFVILVCLPNRLDINTLEDKMDEFQNTTGNIASSVFYKGEKKDQAPMALTGEIIVHFKPDWNENRIAEWAKNMDLETIKSLPFSQNTYLFKAGPGLKSLEIANRVYLSGEVIYAYPNWWKAMELKSNQAMPTDMNISKENKFSPAENTGFERYIWFNGDCEEQVFAALDEVAIFPKIVSEKTNVTERLVKNFDPTATLIKDYEFVILVCLPNRLDINTLEDKMDEFQNTTGNIASSVFYKGEKKDQAPMALTGEIIVHFKPDWNENRIAEWAKNMDLEIIKTFPFSQNTYLFKADPGLKSLEIANQIYRSGEVIYAYPNWWKAMNIRAIPDDHLFSDQWHLQNTGQGGGTSGEDVNIISVWDSYRGSDNEVIAIVDDGLELLHEDLAPNILSGYSWDYVGNDPDPTEGYHGTSVAGVAAARGWNTLGVTGAAPNTKLVGYRLLDAGTDANEASALNNNLQIVDIYSNSWGPYDDRRLEGPGPLTQAALASGTANGRGGKGNIYVWAGGNGNDVANENLADNSNYDGYANSRYVMSIAASSNYGRQSGYSEDGANILVNAPSNGGSLGITTTDRTGALGYDTGDYTSTFGGTSSATPLASGIISLMLQANPDLTWRDVRLILAKNAEKNDLSDVDWTTNGAGYHINHKYGFGRIDADAAVSSAANWTNVGAEVAVAAFNSPNLPIPDNNAAGVSDTIDITQEIKIEFVEIYFTAADHTYWGDLEIELTSPSGTKSILAKRHGVASLAQRYDNWTFGSVRHMGESSLGTWQLAVMDKASADTGTFQEWGLRIYGREDPIWKGLQYLRTIQNPDGSWTYTGRSSKGEKSPVGYSERGGTMESVGVTSLAALAFLNAGYDESDPTVSKAINWILSNTQPDGSITTNLWTSVYDTNMAILALVATYNSDYNDPKQEAMNYLISAQNDDGDGLTTSDYQYGGWGYHRDGWDWSDLSNTQFALMALDAAQLDEDSAVWTKADEYFITRCQNREATNPDYNFHDDGGFIYYPGSTIWAGGQSYGSMTAAGVWSLLLCGVDPTTDGRLQDALDWLDNQHYHVDQNYPMGNTWAYYYILTFVKAYTMAEAKGWNSAHNWYEDASNFLINNQASDGHWPNIEGDESCDVLATTEAILSLQVREIPTNIQRLSYLTFILCSNADLHVYDPLGRHVGKNYDTGGIDLEIPNAVYTSNGVQNITIPGLEIGNYRIVLVGTGDGEYTLNVTGGVGDSTVSEDSYTETISEGEVHEATVNVAIITGLTIHVEEPEPISIDNDIALFFNGLWLADTNGNREADLFFWYGGAEGDIPLTGDCNRDGTGDIAVFNGGLWLVDTNSDLAIDSIFMYGFAGATPLVGDINQDGTDDIAVFCDGLWFVDTNGDHLADDVFGYGFAGATPLVGDINQDGTDDIAVFCDGLWFVDTNGDHLADDVFGYGFAGATPLVGDINPDGTDDIAVFCDGVWFVDTNGDHLADDVFGYGFAGATPLVGNIG